MFSRSLVRQFTVFTLLSSYVAWLVYAQDSPQIGDPGVMITNEQYNATWTHLTGWEGCGFTKASQISQAFWDAARVMNRGDVVNTHSGNTGINWAGAAAVEYLGAPFNDPWQGTLQALYNHAATFEPSYISWPTDFTINVRCDDPYERCFCREREEDKAEAYTVNSGGSNNNGPFINFCPMFHDAPSLGAVLGFLPNQPPDVKYNVDNYNNQAFIFLHEMFHVDAISAPNQHIGDLWLNPGDGGDWEPAYGADFAKLVARAQNPGGWVIRNAENLAIFAMVMEYQSALGGNYPALPFSQDPLDDDPRARNPNPNSIFNFTDGTLGIANLSAHNQLSPKFDNPESVACLAEPAITFDVSAEMFMKDLDYPEEYRSAMSSWKSSYIAHWTTASSSASDVPSAPTAVASTTGTPSAPTDASFPASATPTSTPTKLPIIPSKARCTCSYKVLYDEFEILGLNFAYQDLKRQLDGCGLVTDWNVQNVVGDPDDMQFKATGKLPIGTKACVGRAVVSAGGNTADQCTGAG